MSDVWLLETSEQGPNRLLTIAAACIAMSIAMIPVWISVNDYEWASSPLVVTAPLLMLVAALLVVTMVQVRAGGPSTTFAPRSLSIASVLVGTACTAIGFLGILGALAMVLLLPVASALLALAWAQPSKSWTPQTVGLGIAIVPIAAWFAGRADEYLLEALISGSIIALIVLMLVSIRVRRSRRSSPPSG